MKANDMPVPLSASVVITTKNRVDELRIAVSSALRQTADAEVIVIDDGSTDGTSEMVAREFPRARLIRHEDSRGLIVRRNEGARIASGDVIFSIDDDAEFISANTIEQTLREFDDPRIAAVAIPYVEPKKENRVMQKSPGSGEQWVTDSFKGTAHALRRDRFLEAGGYRDDLIHQGEESDLCIRWLARGLVVRLGSADPINHYESPRRDWSRMDYYGRRNDVLFTWHHVPMPFFPGHIAVTVLKGLITACRTRRSSAMFRGLAAGIGRCARKWGERRPVNAAVYRLHRILKKRGPLPLSEVGLRLGSASEATPLK